MTEKLNIMVEEKREDFFALILAITALNENELSAMLLESWYTAEKTTDGMAAQKMTFEISISENNSTKDKDNGVLLTQSQLEILSKLEPHREGSLSIMLKNAQNQFSPDSKLDSLSVTLTPLPKK